MTAPAGRVRNASIDILRGVVMVLMVLDHARDFYFGFRPEATNLAVTTEVLFVTRWVTHFCAPVFVALAGTSAYFYGRRQGRALLRRFLVTRGLWLVLLELTIVRFAWIPELGYHFSVLQVIWAIGWAMIWLAALSWLPLSAVTAISALIVLGHDALDHVDIGSLGPLGVILERRGVLEPLHGHQVFVSYPLLAWFGVIGLGYAFGSLYDGSDEARRRVTLRVGIGLIAGFFVLRGINVYGDPSLWSVQPRGAVFTVLSFLNASKYPPSLLYVAMTLGPALLFLHAIERHTSSRWLKPFAVYGRVPLLFYVAHLYLLRFTALPIAIAKFGMPNAIKPPPGHAGSAELPLYATYAAWIVAVLILYPLCLWFSRLKARRQDWWLSYL